MLRRILWIVPTLFFVSILVFSFLSLTLPEARTGPDGQKAAVFFNPRPDNVRDRALALMKRVAESEGDEQAMDELATLGGAALPHILPRLDELDPAERARVSVALRPVAQRMGLGTREDFASGEATTLFWTRFWQDRALDYRPVVVRRLAKRAGERQLTLRRDDVIQLDTYALPELMRALGRVWGEDDVARAHRLTHLLAHITEKPGWVVREGATVDEANHVVQQWHNWWTDHRDRYTTLDGLARATAMVTQTTYGKWARGLAYGLGTKSTGTTVLEGLKEGAPITLLLIVLGLLGAYPLGAVLGAVGARFGKRSHGIATFGALVFVAVPIAPWVARAGDPGGASLPSTALAAATMLVFGASYTALHQSASSRAKLGGFVARRTRRAPGTWALTRGTGTTSLALFTSDIPLFFLVATVLEHGLGLKGLGHATVVALQAGDVAWLMAVSLLGAVATGLAQVLGEELLRSIGRDAPLPSTRLSSRMG